MLAPSSININGVHATMDHKMVRLGDFLILRDLVLVIVRKFGVRRWECRVDVLGRWLVLSFGRPILVKSTTNKVGTVRQLRTGNTDVDRL